MKKYTQMLSIFIMLTSAMTLKSAGNNENESKFCQQTSLFKQNHLFDWMTEQDVSVIKKLNAKSYSNALIKAYKRHANLILQEKYKSAPEFKPLYELKPKPEIVPLQEINILDKIIRSLLEYDCDLERKDRRSYKLLCLGQTINSNPVEIKKILESIFEVYLKKNPNDQFIKNTEIDIEQLTDQIFKAQKVNLGGLFIPRKSLFHTAVYMGHKKLLKLLMYLGAPVDKQTKERIFNLNKELVGHTPLALAALRGDNAVLDILLNEGASPELVDTLKEETPLHLAIINNHEEIALKLAEDFPELVNRTTLKKKTAFTLACDSGNFALALKLVQDYGAKPSAASKKQLSKIFTKLTGLFRRNENITQQDFIDILKHLLDIGINCNSTDHDGISILHEFAGLDSELLLIEEASELKRYEYYARIKPIRKEIIKTLLNKGARVDLESKCALGAFIPKGSTPIHIAGFTGHKEILQSLITQSYIPLDTTFQPKKENGLSKLSAICTQYIGQNIKEETEVGKQFVVTIPEKNDYHNMEKIINHLVYILDIKKQKKLAQAWNAQDSFSAMNTCRHFKIIKNILAKKLAMPISNKELDIFNYDHLKLNGFPGIAYLVDPDRLEANLGDPIKREFNWRFLN